MKIIYSQIKGIKIIDMTNREAVDMTNGDHIDMKKREAVDITNREAIYMTNRENIETPLLQGLINLIKYASIL